MADFLLGIDAGGTTVKVAVISATGEERGLAGTTFRPLAPAPGHAERDPEALWRAVGEATRRALAAAGVGGGDIAAVGVTGYGNGLYLLDEAGQAVTPGILAPDIRAAEIVEAWRAEGVEAAQLAKSYQPLWPGRPLPLLAWFKRARPEVLRRARTLLLCKDYLRFRLTGLLANEVTDLSTAALVPGAQRAPDAALFDGFGLGDCLALLPPVVETLSLAGEITPAAAEATGLKAGTPVSAGCCDNLALMYGCGAVEEDSLVVASGTWGLQQSFLSAPVTDGSLVIVAHAAEPGRWLAIEGSPTSAGNYEWFLDTFLRALPGGASAGDLYAVCDRLVEEAEEGGPAVFFLPYLNGAIDCSSARGSFIGFSTWHRLGHALRALYEGVAFEHRRHLERLLAHRPRRRSARFAGGAARSATWSRIFAAALRLPLEVPQGEELGARGAALLAACAIGRYPTPAAAAAAMTRIVRRIEPEPALADLLERRFAASRSLAAALAPHWKELSRTGC